MGLLAELGEMRRQHASERAADASRIATLYAENAELRERVGRAENASEAASTRANTLQAEVDRLRARRWWRWWWRW
jgi:hypothetical protein